MSAYSLKIHYVCMTQYDATIPGVEVAFKPQSLKNTFGEYISDLGMTQLRIAETEKYAHVTFFFNGGVEKEYPGEDRVLIPSPKVATYDLQPEMSEPAGYRGVRKAHPVRQVRCCYPELRKLRHGRSHRRIRGCSQGCRGHR